MKKIGLIIANPITNYGAHLQGYATQCVIDSLGAKTAVLDIAKVKGKAFVDFGYIVEAFKVLSRRVFKNNQKQNYDSLFRQNVKERTRRADEFRSRRLHDVVTYTDYARLIRDAKSYDTIMIGSDQMWPPGMSFSSLYSLRFVPQGVKRASYATSLGVSEYPRYCWNSARDMWTKMDYLSVREEQGANIIRTVCKDKVDVKVVVDPTYLMTKEQWEDVIPIQRMSERRYVFCYFLGDDVNSKLCAKRYAEKNNLHLVSILSCESFSDIDYIFTALNKK